MIRAEIKTNHKAFVFCEDTLEDAQAYVAALIREGVTIESAEYYDRDQRVNAIRKGRV